MAQTQVKPITNSELSSILSGNVDSILTPATETKVDETKTEDKIDGVDDTKVEPQSNVVDWKEIKKIAEITDTDDQVDNQDDDQSKVITEVKKPGRKPTDLVSLVNDLITDNILIGFAGDEEIKTIEDAKELIKANIENVKNGSFEDIWKSKIESYSPQVQAIIQYAESGGTDINPLLSAIAEVESTANFTLDDEKGQEAIVREYLKVQGWDEDDIKDEIDTAKDLEKLKGKAEKFLPKLNQMKQERINLMMEEQRVRQAQAEEARINYLKQLQSTLNKEKVGDLKLQRQDKALIWNSLTDVNYRSLSGHPTNGFFKRLEDLQIGQTADYDHFMEIVHLAMDRDGFKKKYTEQISTAQAADTARKLKVQEKNLASSNTPIVDDSKPVIKRQSFKNPFG